jgi:hypothetical protein
MISNTSFSPKNFFSPASNLNSMRTFGISFDGSYSYIGGNHKVPNPQKIHLYVNLLENGKLKTNKKKKDKIRKFIKIKKNF